MGRYAPAPGKDLNFVSLTQVSPSNDDGADGTPLEFEILSKPPDHDVNGKIPERWIDPATELEPPTLASHERENNECRIFEPVILPGSLKGPCSRGYKHGGTGVYSGTASPSITWGPD